MHTYNTDPRYGVKPSTDVRSAHNNSVIIKSTNKIDERESPQKNSENKSATTLNLSATKPREDHIILPNTEKDFTKTF